MITRDNSELAFALFFGTLQVITLGCAREKPTPVVPPRAVTVDPLAVTDPHVALRLPGSVTAWKEEQIGFQVGGRVKEVRFEAGQDLTGPEHGSGMTEGAVIARLDSPRFEAAVASAEANLLAAEAQMRVTNVRMTQIIPEDLSKAETEVKRSESFLQRMEQAFESKSVAASDVEDAKAAADVATANFRTVESNLIAIQDELKVREASVIQAKAALRQANLDLQDTELFAPFDARVNEVHVTPGAIVQAGSPIVSVVVMDPLKVEIVVSAARDRQLNMDDEVLVFSEASPQPIPAIVYQKSAVADASTRTFTVSLLCRNRRMEAAEQPDADAVPIAGFMRPQQFEVDGQPTWFVEEDCIHQRDGQSYAWQVVQPTGRPQNAALQVERVDLKIGQARRTIFDLFSFRQLIPEGPLAENLAQPDGRWQTVLATGVPDDYDGKNKVVKFRRDWLLRPGGIVGVQLENTAHEPGIYVRKKYIRLEGNQAFVFLAGDNGSAKKVAVNITGSLGDLNRIEGDGIRPGARMITSGTHYLVDGTQIAVIK